SASRSASDEVTDMADGTPAPNSSPDPPRGAGAPPPPMRDPGGWGVAPAPDGRGTPEPPAQQPPHRRPRFWMVVVAILALNLLISVLISHPSSSEPRVKVPFSPYFLTQVDKGEVKSITSKNDSIQGTFKHHVKFPPDDKSAKSTTLFSTEVPAFWDN